MSDYISREAALTALQNPELFNVSPIFLKIIRDLPAADVEPVRRGRWECVYDDSTGETDITCSHLRRKNGFGGIIMRISENRHKNQFCFLPTIGILYGLSGEYSVRIAAMWLSWCISIGIVKNPHYEEGFVWRAFQEMEDSQLAASPEPPEEGGPQCPLTAATPSRMPFLSCWPSSCRWSSSAWPGPLWTVWGGCGLSPPFPSPAG